MPTLLKPQQIQEQESTHAKEQTTAMSQIHTKFYTLMHTASPKHSDEIIF